MVCRTPVGHAVPEQFVRENVRRAAGLAMAVVGLHDVGYILGMEVFHFHVSRDVLLTIVMEGLALGLFWALRRFYLKVRGWFVGVSVLRSEVQRLKYDCMELRTEVLRAHTVSIPVPAASRDSIPPPVIPPPLPTVDVEGWEDDEDDTSLRT